MSPRAIHTVACVYRNGGSGNKPCWNTQLYYYLTYEMHEPGDYVTVESPGGGPIVVKVMNWYPNAKLDYATKFIIDQCQYAKWLQDRHHRDAEIRQYRDSEERIRELEKKAKDRAEAVRCKIVKEALLHDEEYQAIRAELDSLRANRSDTTYLDC